MPWWHARTSFLVTLLVTLMLSPVVWTKAVGTVFSTLERIKALELGVDTLRRDVSRNEAELVKLRDNRR